MKKGLIQVFLANVIFLIFGVLNNFVLPKYLSMDSYSLLKSYMFYLQYATFLFGLGYIDGMFLKYGGQNIVSSKKYNFGDNFITYVVMQLSLAVIILIYGIIRKQEIIVLFTIGLWVTNIANYLKNYCTAIGEFKAYSQSLSFEKIGIFFLNVFILFVIQLDDYMGYAWVLIIVPFLECLYIFCKLYNIDQELFSGKVKIKELAITIKNGIALMLGNFASTLFTGLDRWFIKLFMLISDFAIYSFAVSLEQIMNTFITPISITLYSYFCRELDDQNIREIKRMITLWGLGILAVAFPIKAVIKLILVQYMDAVSVIFILFAGQAVTCIINSIYVNVYNAQKKQKKYMLQMIGMTLCAGILNGLFYMIFRSMLSIAAATLCTKLIWLILCERLDKRYCYSNGEYLAISILLTIYIICGIWCNAWLGMALYIIAYVIISLVFMRQTLIKIYEIVGSLIANSIRTK